MLFDSILFTTVQLLLARGRPARVARARQTQLANGLPNLWASPPFTLELQTEKPSVRV